MEYWNNGVKETEKLERWSDGLLEYWETTDRTLPALQ
jgi:hypothetical protein